MAALPRQAGSDGSSTLLLKHIPESLTADTLKNVLSQWKAVDVRHFAAGRLRNCCFVDFQSQEDARKALKELHGLRILNRVLAAEFVRTPAAATQAPQPPPLPRDRPPGTAPPPPAPPPSQPPLPPTDRTPGEPIAPTLGVEYAFPPHLRYVYPPADPNVLANISNALVAVPRFYTQVLHLMNKMNLPPPFRPAMPAPPLPVLAAVSAEPKQELPPPPPEPPTSRTAPSAETSEEEEEDEEEEEGGRGAGRAREGGGRRPPLKTAPPCPVTVLPQTRFNILGKRPRLAMQIKLGGREEPLKGSKGGATVGADTGGAATGTGREGQEAGAFASVEELRRGQMPAGDILAMPLFKTYEAGVPTNVLYVKNLAKEVTSSDINYVFGGFVSSRGSAEDTLTVRLMQEGRMKGQAFVTFPSLQEAQAALEAAHGFILKEKPMVIQYGRKTSTTT